MSDARRPLKPPGGEVSLGVEKKENNIQTPKRHSECAEKSATTQSPWEAFSLTKPATDKLVPARMPLPLLCIDSDDRVHWANGGGVAALSGISVGLGGVHLSEVFAVPPTLSMDGCPHWQRCCLLGRRSAQWLSVRWPTPKGSWIVLLPESVDIASSRDNADHLAHVLTGF